MAVTSWLVDKSAYVRMQSGQAAQLQEWSGRIERGLMHVEGMPKAVRVRRID